MENNRICCSLGKRVERAGPALAIAGVPARHAASAPAGPVRLHAIHRCRDPGGEGLLRKPEAAKPPIGRQTTPVVTLILALMSAKIAFGAWGRGKPCIKKNIKKTTTKHDPASPLPWRRQRSHPFLTHTGHIRAMLQRVMDVPSFTATSLALGRKATAVMVSVRSMAGAKNPPDIYTGTNEAIRIPSSSEAATDKAVHQALFF